MVDRIQSSSETTHERERNKRLHTKFKENNRKMRKLRRCKPVKAKVVAHTKEISGRCQPDVASKFLE